MVGVRLIMSIIIVVFVLVPETEVLDTRLGSESWCELSL